MPRRVLPQFEVLHQQIRSILTTYRRMLDDEFVFAAAVQVPQVAAIFDIAGDAPLHFRGETLSLAEMLTLIACRYGFNNVECIGQGGYAVVLGNPRTVPHQPRRVLRLVPEHHVRNILAVPGSEREFDVHLDNHQEPIRDPVYPLLVSDLFLLPRHTTRLVFMDRNDVIIKAAGQPAILHCQLLPEVCPLNSPGLDPQMARQAGELLEAALATVGVSVADAHGGNGGVLIGADGKPLIHQSVGTGKKNHYTPLVLDYGYYSEIGTRKLADVLLRHGVAASHVPGILPRAQVAMIEQSNQPRSHFGRMLFAASVVDPAMWITQAEDRWKTIKEQTYPALHAQSRLARLYPDYDEVLFPQRIETYNFQI